MVGEAAACGAAAVTVDGQTGPSSAKVDATEAGAAVKAAGAPAAAARAAADYKGALCHL